MRSNPPVYSVKQVNQYLKMVIETDEALSDIWIKGEISNFTAQKSGHLYFSIKEQGSVLKAVMFAGDAWRLRFKPENGMKVLLRGGLNVYEPSGQYQIIVKEIQPDGIGSLYLAFEELKKKLQTEGLFDENRKQELPTFPKTIGVITSATGAAVQDIMTTIKRRYPIANILLMPVVVQGEQCPESVIDAIEKMNEHGEADVLIVGRGGGSIEDLWGFNDEGVARAIFASKIPVISAVGHETDFTIADFVSDMRAPTPTAAAELATPYTLAELKRHILNLSDYLPKRLTQLLLVKKDKLERIHKNLMFRHPQKLIQTQQQRLDMLVERLQNNVKKNVSEKEHKLLLLMAKLDGLSPLKTMSRGYGLAYKNDTLVKSTKELEVNDTLSLKLHDGTITCRVENIEEEK